MKRKRSHAPNFGVAFLDCICCGFGAVILLFVISMGAQSKQIQGVNESLNEVLKKRLAQLTQIQSNTETLTQQDAAQQERLSKLTTQEKELAANLAQLAQSLQDAQSGQEKLVTDIDEKRENIAAQQKKLKLLQRQSPSPVGLPVESNHIIFVIDTSPSMRNRISNRIHHFVIEAIEEVLESYPRVEGIQVYDADGRYIVRRSNGTWLEDNPGTRTTVAKAIRQYDKISQSNPVPGIVRAIRTFAEPDNPESKVGIYVFGDQFQDNIDRVLRRIDVINAADEKGQRPVTINAIGFPTVPDNDLSRLKYANLMRELTYQNNGAFVAYPDQ